MPLLGLAAVSSASHTAASHAPIEHVVKDGRMRFGLRIAESCMDVPHPRCQS